MQEDKHRYFHIASITLLHESYLGYIKTPFSRGRNSINFETFFFTFLLLPTLQAWRLYISIVVFCLCCV